MRKILIDCDPGHDDMIMLFMALASEELDILGITTSAGNQTQTKTLTNTMKLLTYVGRTDIPVAKGSEKPIINDLIIADYVHGETGLDGAELQEIHMEPQPIGAVEFMYKTLMAAEEPVTIVVTGPMTNVALLLMEKPEVKEKIECISFMGGACMGGNITPRAEFNIYVDPEAAKIVMNSGVPLIMSGLDVTYKAQLMPEDVERIRAIGNETSKIVVPLLEFFAKSTTMPFLAEEGHIEGIHMHDPCALAVLLDPSKFLIKDFFGDIELSGEYSRGSTIIDYDKVLGKEANVSVCFDIDREWMADLIVDSIAKLR